MQPDTLAVHRRIHKYLHIPAIANNITFDGAAAEADGRRRYSLQEEMKIVFILLSVKHHIGR